MNSERFFDLVRRMRQSQKMYFETHLRTHLIDSKRLEKTVDAEIKRVEDLQTHRENPQLF